MNKGRVLNSRRSATVLLATFVLGGLLLPVAHRVHHGLEYAAQYDHDCDHTHPGWHPEFEFVDEDDCLLCQRVTDLAEGEFEQAASWLGSQCAACEPARVLVSTVQYQKPIRGPPASAVALSQSHLFTITAAAGAPVTLLFA